MGTMLSFFKYFLPTTGDEVSEVVMQFFHSGNLLKEVNNTIVTPIPKVPNTTYVKKFRLIACCSIMYKIDCVEGIYLIM